VLLAARTLPVGRSGITLRGLRRATTYRLTLTVACGDGQHAHDVAVLRVARR
jgi:hypothetical protein